MATATSFATPFVTGGVAQSKKHSLQTDKLKYLNGYPSKVVVPQNSKLTKHRPNLSVHAKYSDGTRDGSSDFIAGFVLGGAIFGTLAYVFAPQVNNQLAKHMQYMPNNLVKARQSQY
ncbi:hypothetical protein Cni_G03652 [Canna indica]|uniref:Uncharacterized protein n=1 Tax=Canna indica TaxID=4628 RepID=A0AAQ3JRZ9_9LILI|nr:hypothetical protein Cni_G03652 [Canna indica]